MTATADTDAILLARIRAGDARAAGTLYDRYESQLFRFLVGILRDRHQAEDVLQETFVQVLRSAEKANPETFRGWLFTVAHRQALLLKRRAKLAPRAATETLFALAGPDTPDAIAAGRDDARRIGELLAQLPIAQQAVIRLRVVDGLPFREVAARLKVPLNTALWRMHAGLASLRQAWEVGHV